MYLRSISRRNRDGSEVRYYQLAENVWDPNKKCAVAKVVYSFGRSDQLDRQALERLAKSILRVFPSEQALAAEPDVRVLGAWPYGGVHVLDSLWRELEIPQVLATIAKRQRTTQPLERALFSMVANRALHPCSKLRCHHHWLEQQVFLPGQQEIALQHLYRAMDLLHDHKAEIEHAIYLRVADLFNVDVDLIFYDTTSLHFEVDEEDEEAAQTDTTEPVPRARQGAVRRRGYSKNGRGDAPQVVVGLAVTRDGWPVRCWVFPGNTNDAETVEHVKADLRGWKLNRCVFVGDAGMNSDENRRTLSKGGGSYILATRLRAGDEVSSEVLTRAGRYQVVADNLQVKEVIVGEGERRRRYIVCFNPQEAERQAKHRETILASLREELASLRRPGPAGGHSKRTCSLLTSARYRRYLRQTRRGALRLNQAAIAAEAKLDGKWVITSNDDSLGAEDLALGYKQLMRVEQSWRVMKSGLRARPVFHWTSRRIEAHISLCVLALLLERMAETRGGDTWRNLLDRLDEIKVVDYQRGSARVLQTSEVRGELPGLLQRLNVALPPRLHSLATARP